MSHRAFSHRLGRGRTVFLQKLLFERTRVYAYSYRHIVETASLRNGSDLIVGAYIAGVYSYLIDARRNTFERATVIEMDISHDGDFYSFLYRVKSLYSLCIRHGETYNLTAGVFECDSLSYVTLCVLRGDVEH